MIGPGVELAAGWEVALIPVYRSHGIVIGRCWEHSCREEMVSAGKTVRQKYMEDIWSIVGYINKGEAVTCALLKDGKKSKVWQQSQARQERQGIG